MAPALWCWLCAHPWPLPIRNAFPHRGSAPYRVSCAPCRCTHGTCLPINAFSYSCKCQPGYTGVLCDEEEEVFNPCQSIKCKHGKCRLSGLGKAYCECNSGYTGEGCDRGKAEPLSIATNQNGSVYQGLSASGFLCLVFFLTEY